VVTATSVGRGLWGKGWDDQWVRNRRSTSGEESAVNRSGRASRDTYSTSLATRPLAEAHWSSALTAWMSFSRGTPAEPSMVGARPERQRSTVPPATQPMPVSTSSGVTYCCVLIAASATAATRVCRRRSTPRRFHIVPVRCRQHAAWGRFQM
jgi:hypothetical protein